VLQWTDADPANAAHASDDSIRTHSHTAREVLWAGRTIDGRDSPPRSSTGVSCVRRIADSWFLRAGLVRKPHHCGAGTGSAHVWGGLL